MQIKITGQPIPISKVETDQREEVKKIKPIGSQQIPDSFETGKSQSSDQQSNSSASAEPEKKAGQITGGILIKQMAQARLSDAGIKLTNQAKENTGTMEFNNTQQGQAEATSPKVNTKGNPRTPGIATDYGARVPDGAYTGDARSNMEQRRGALEDFFAQQNIDTSSGDGIKASDFGVGQGVDLGNGFNGGPTGPGDPMDNVNDQFARRDYLNGVGNAGNRLNSQMQDATQGMDGANMNFGKDMIREPWLGVDLTPEEIAAAKKKYAAEHPDDAPAKPAPPEKDPNAAEGPSFKDIVINFMLGQGPKGVVLPPTPPDPETGKSMLDGFKAIFGSKDRTPESETKKGGTKNATDQTEENYVNSDELRNMDGMLENLGLDGLWNLQRGPKDQGKGPDYGPEGPGPVGVSAEDAGGSLLSQFGKDGLVGNPNQQNHNGSGPSNFGGMPGETVTDPIEGEPYSGTPRDADVDVSVQTGMEENVDDEDKNNRTIHANDIRKEQSKLNPNIQPKLNN